MTPQKEQEYKDRIADLEEQLATQRITIYLDFYLKASEVQDDKFLKWYGENLSFCSKEEWNRLSKEEWNRLSKQ